MRLSKKTLLTIKKTSIFPSWRYSFFYVIFVIITKNDQEFITMYKSYSINCLNLGLDLIYDLMELETLAIYGQHTKSLLLVSPLMLPGLPLSSYSYKNLFYTQCKTKSKLGSQPQVAQGTALGLQIKLTWFEEYQTNFHFGQANGSYFEKLP